MGVFYNIRSIALSDSIPIEGPFNGTADFYEKADKAYDQVRTVFSGILISTSLKQLR